MKPKVLFIANNNLGSAYSGGDTIFVAFLKYWKENADITLLGSQEALSMAQRRATGGYVELLLSNSTNKEALLSFTDFAKHIIQRTLDSTIYIFKNYKNLKKFDYIFSASDFYPDFIPALILKLFNRKFTWISAYYVFALPPWHKNSPYRKTGKIKGFFYWFLQRPSYYLVNIFADYVCITSLPDKKAFVTKKRDPSKVIIVQGGVETTEANEYLSSGKVIPVDERKYDALYIGRFHEQKGLFELLAAWKLVIEKNPYRKLVMVGGGELLPKLLTVISKYQMSENVIFVGYKEVSEKYEVFKESKIVVHPLTYDPGGMGSAEAMAWGIPGISFDLEGFKTYYPKGMLKIPCFEIVLYAEGILKLLNDKEYYEQMSKDAVAMIKENFDWPARADMLYSQIFYGK